MTITLDAVDAAVVGTTLRMLATINRSPDIDVAARLQRVGDALTRDAKEVQAAGGVQ